MKSSLSRKSLLLLAMIVINVINALGGILGNIVSEDIKEGLVWAGIFRYRIPITVGLIITGLLVAVWVFKAEKEETLSDELSESEKAYREFLSDLAERYRDRNTHKLDGRYEISLLVSDDLQGTHARQFDEEFSTHAHLGEAAQYIIERFEEHGRLLIVGGPGSGKTVLLVTLAKYLTKKAQEDSTQPLPVILNLDSWSADYERFDDWVDAMLTKGYGLSSDFARLLLAEQRIIFLLDGLDELARNEEPQRAAQVRAQCLMVLDKSLHDGMMNAVICCRLEQFNAMLGQTGIEPPVAAVAAVQDLTPGQIDRALLRASHTQKDKFAAPHLLAELGRSASDVYYQTLSTPFYFTTALQVFDSTRPTHIDAPDRQTLEANLVAAFVEKKLNVTPNPRFPAAKTYAWLSWLAAFLETRVTFELADLQPSALKREWRYRLLFSLLIGVSVTLIMAFDAVDADGIFFACFFGLVFGLMGVYVVVEDFTKSALSPLRNHRTWDSIIRQGMLIGVLFRILFAITFIWDLIIKLPERKPSDRITHFIAGLIVMSIYGSVVVYFTSAVAIIFGALVHLVKNMSIGIWRRAGSSNIVTEDFARWTLTPLWRAHTWRQIFAHSLSTSVTAGTTAFALSCVIFGGFILAMKLGEVVAVAENQAVWTLSMTLLFVMLFSIVVGLIGAGVSFVFSLFLDAIGACRQISRFASIKSPYRRLLSGLAFNVLQGVVMGAGFICFVQATIWLSDKERGYLNLSSSILMISAFGVLGLFRTPLLKHSVLRLCLTMESAAPLRYVDFLNYATQLRILEMEGGQWRFRHQILQDYFAHHSPETDGGLART